MQDLGLAVVQGKVDEVVVAEDEEEGLVENRHDIRQVLHGQVAGAEYQVDVAESLAQARRIDDGVYLVGNA